MTVEEYLKRRKAQEDRSSALPLTASSEAMEVFLDEDLLLQEYEFSHADKALSKLEITLDNSLLYKLSVLARRRHITPNEFIVIILKRALEKDTFFTETGS